MRRDYCDVVFPRAPRAVVFDLDGVLVDSEDIWAAAEGTTVRELGGDYTPELAAQLYGRGHRDGGRLLARRYGGDPEAVAERLLGHALAGFRRGVQALPAAVETVESLRGRLPLGVASNSVRPIVEAALGAVGLDASFDAVVCGDDVERPKPAPDVYLAACRALGVLPTDALAVEDSPVGVTAAKAAGLVVVGVPSLPGVELPAADVVLCSLADLDVRVAA
jgi:HAD superfamily hydrolase (TIGR01509 family)